MELSNASINFHVYMPIVAFKTKVPMDLDETWNIFGVVRIKDLFTMIDSKYNKFKVDKIILDGKKISHCCRNFGNIACCKANKKLRDLNFQQESIIEYHFK